MDSLCKLAAAASTWLTCFAGCSVKPANVLLSRTPESFKERQPTAIGSNAVGCAKLADFGGARRLNARGEADRRIGFV